MPYLFNIFKYSLAGELRYFNKVPVISNVINLNGRQFILVNTSENDYKKCSITTQSNIIIYSLFRIRTDRIATELGAAKPPGG